MPLSSLSLAEVRKRIAMKLINWLCSVLAVCLILAPPASSQQSALPYRNPALPIDARVSDLLKRMTLEEKVAQLESTWQNHSFDLQPEEFFVDEKGQLDGNKA